MTNISSRTQVPFQSTHFRLWTLWLTVACVGIAESRELSELDVSSTRILCGSGQLNIVAHNNTGRDLIIGRGLDAAYFTFKYIDNCGHEPIQMEGIGLIGNSSEATTIGLLENHQFTHFVDSEISSAADIDGLDVTINLTDEVIPGGSFHVHLSTSSSEEFSIHGFEPNHMHY